MICNSNRLLNKRTKGKIKMTAVWCISTAFENVYSCCKIVSFNCSLVGSYILVCLLCC